MEINWPEIVIGTFIAFVLGAVFTLFVQPRIERRLAHRRTRRQLEIERQDAEIAAEIARLAANPDLFTARFREGVLRILFLLLAALIVTLFGLVMEWIPGLIFGSLIPFVLALTLAVPTASACSRLLTLSQGVRASLEEDARRPE